MPILANPKHELFAQEVAKGVPASRAYVTAGFKEHRQNASGLARKEHIKARVAEILAHHVAEEKEATTKAVEALAIDKQWVLGRLVENVERSMQAVEITREGKGTGEYKYDGAVANKALELIGKEMGMFREAAAEDKGNALVQIFNMLPPDMQRGLATTLTIEGEVIEGGS